MKQTDFRELRILAQRHGILLEYLDMAGARQETAPEVLQAILGALGIPAANPKEISESLHEAELRDARRCIEPVIVAWDKEPVKIRLRLPKPQGTIRCRLRLEEGEGKIFSVEWGAHAPRVHFSVTSRKISDGRNADPPRDIRTTQVRWARGASSDTRGRVCSPLPVFALTLPALPFGYHELELEVGDSIQRALIISAPEKTYTEPQLAKQWGIFAPMYAVHSEQSWGAGNFTDWLQLSKWIGALRGNVAATLPLLAQFMGHPTCEPSPYSPASRLFWNEFYIDITAAPEFATCAAAQRLVSSRAFQKRLGNFRASRMIDYSEEWKARRKILELLAEHFFRRWSTRYGAFSKFLIKRPELEDYARFRAVCDRRKERWHKWPARLRDGNLRAGDLSEGDQRFHLYAQWVAQEQIDHLVEHSRRVGVKLYLDLPLGVNADGYDLWRHRENFTLDSAAGAPPDTFFTKGQNWGFSPLHPERIRENGYRYIREFLQFQMRQAGLLRIDHVMGLHRLYWIPRGFSAAQGAYVSYRPEEWYAILSVESHRHKTMLVGENLGTIPPEVNESMRRHRVRETYVAQYEQRSDCRQPLRPPPALSLASINTHDMPTYAAHWAGLDIRDRRRLGLIPYGKVARENENRRRLNNILARFLSMRGFLKSGKPDAKSIFDALLEWLGRSDAQFVIANLEDLWLEKSPQNVPGTSTERPNWRRKTRLTVEEMKSNRRIAGALREIAKWREG